MIKRIAGGILLGMCSLTAQASLITNGSFETGPALGPSSAITVPKPSGPMILSTAITGWVVTVQEVEYIETGGFNLVAQDGINFIDLTGNDDGLATIEQTVGLQVGKTYTLDFWIGGSNLYPNDADPAVTVGISGLSSQTFTGGRDQANDWRQFSWSFQAALASTTISFSGALDGGGDCCYIGLDNVSLVPAPAGIALFGIGLVGIGFARRATRLKSRC